jgi:hypothetical protein
MVGKARIPALCCWSASTKRCPLIRCCRRWSSRPARPVSSPSGVRSSGVRVRDRPSSCLVSTRPVSGCLVSARLSCRVRLSRVTRRWRWDRSVRRAALRQEQVEVSVIRRALERLGRRLEQTWTRATLRRSSVGHRGVVADLAGWCSGGRRRPRSTDPDQAGQPGGRIARHCRLRQGRGAAAARRCCICQVAAVFGLDERPLSVVVVEAGARGDRPGRPTELADGDGYAAPARPSQAAGTPGPVPATL